MSEAEAQETGVLGEQEYRQLRRATRTHREELVVRLGAEAGLRPGEMARLRPAHVETRRHDGRAHALLSVPGEDGSTVRTAYLPAGVEHDLQQYVHAEDIGDDDRVLPVSARRLQMLVSEVAERAAARTGEEALAAVSSRSLRRYFARRLLAEEGVDPRVVQAVGGWDRLASLEPYLPAPDTAEVVGAFAGTTLARDAVDGGAPGDEPPPAGEDGRGGTTPADGATADPSGGATGSTATPHSDALFGTVEEVGNALGRASMPAEVTARVCETLADGDPFTAAVYLEPMGEEATVTAVAGVGETDPEGIEPPAAVDAALDTGEVRSTTTLADDPAFAALREPDWTSEGEGGAVVPVTDGATTHGALCVVGPAGAVGTRGRAVLGTLGTVVGSVVTAAERRKILLADTVVELELRSMDEDGFFVALSADHDCSVDLEGVVPGEGRSLVYFVTVGGAPAEDVVGWAADQAAVDDARLVRDHGEEALLEFVLAGADPSKTLVERGGSVREMTASGGTQRVVADLSADADVRRVLDALTDAFPATELLTKRERERPVETAGSVGSSLRDALTEKQAAVLQAAFHAGYFEWPRGSTAEELADAIGITSPTLHNHLRRAQQKLLSEFFAGEETPLSETPWTE